VAESVSGPLPLSEEGEFVFTVRRAQIDALGRHASRRVRLEWIESLRARGLAVREEAATGNILVEDAAGGKAIINPQPGGIEVTSSEKGPSGEDRTYGFQYNAEGKVREVTDPAGLRVVFDYDERQRLSAVHRGVYGRFSFLYDADDNLAGIRYPDNSRARFDHDSSGRVVRAVDRNGHSREFEYSPFGPPSRIIGPKGETTSFEFDQQGNLNAVVAPLGERQTYEDDPSRQGIVIRRDGRPTLEFSFDPGTGTQEFRYPDGTLARFEYSDGRLATAANNDSTVRLTYDANGRVRAEETDGRVVRYERNTLGAITAMVTPEGERIVFERDSEGRLRRIREKSGEAYTLDYELSGALASIRYPNGIVATRACNPLGYPESLIVKSPAAAVPLLDVAWEYDACDRLSSETLIGERWQEFRYDREGRLEQAGLSGVPWAEEVYVLDPNGNRLSDRGLPCSFNLSDQLVQKGADEFLYNAQGNMIEGLAPAGRIQCKYNGRGQLVEAITSRQVTRYAYDPFGRRIRKEEPGRVTRYTWAGQWLLSEVVEENGRSSRRDYLVVPELGVPLAQRVDGWNYYVHHGRRFEPLLMTDRSGRVVWRARYDAFGAATIENPEVPLPLRLPGQYFDAETGLHYNLARYYDPGLGRYLQRDPLGSDAGSWNEYIYCGGDPLNRYDPTGEFLPILIGAAIGAVVAGGIEAYRQHKANPNAKLEWGKIGKEALIGGLVGGLGAAVALAMAPAVAAAGAIVAAAGGGVVGAVSAAVETCASSLAHGEIPKAADVLHSAEFGFGIGALTAGAGAIWANRARRAALAARESEEAERRLQQGAREAEEAERRAQQAVNKRPCTDGCPVDSLAGEVIEWKTDFVLPGALELALKRSYSSGLQYSSGFGPRWASNWSQFVEVEGATVTYCGGDGEWVKFDLPRAGSESWIKSPDVAQTSIRHVGGTFEVRDPNRSILRFKTRIGNRWLLKEIEDPNGYWIHFTYTENGALRLVESSGGYRLAVEGTAGQFRRVVLLVDKAGPIELMRYSYDERGRLTEVIDGSGLPFRYTYDDANRLIRWQDRKGTWNQYQYDARGRCVRAFGPDRMYDYRFEYDEHARTNTVTDSLGNVKTYSYNECKQPVIQTDARGGVMRTVWDRQSNKLEERDPEGRGMIQQFDADGNLTLVRDALGGTTRIAYNALGLPEALTDAAGNTWKRAYDERGNLIQAQGPDGAAWRYERDANGNLVRMIDPAGNARRYGYDAHGLLVWSTDARGNRLRLERDALGRVTERIDPLGRRTLFRYNSLGKLAEAVLADGAHLRWEYDAEGNLERRIGPDGKTYSYSYGWFDLLREVTKPSGGKLKLGYDTEARLSTVENELGQFWRYQYNAAGQVIREQDFHGRVQQFDYDGSGLCIRRVNGLGQEILLDRDAVGQLIAQRGTEEACFEYDALGRVQRAVQGAVEVALERDAYGRVVRERQGGHVVESTYNSRGLRVKRATAAGECEWQWDANGQVAALKLPGDELLEFVHDTGGREVERRARGGLVLRQEYDAMDRLAKQWAGMTAGASRQVAALVEREFRYDINGDPIEIRDARWGVSRFAYDADGRIARAQRERGPSEEFTYDPAGNIASARELPSDVAPRPARVTVGMKTRFFGKDGRLERVGDTRYEWDADGRLKEKREGARRWRYAWTPEGRLESVRDPEGRRWRYEYDAFGRRVQKAGPSGATRFVWDGAAIADEVRDGRGTAAWFFEPGSFRPLLKQEGGKTYQCVADQVGTPRELLTNEGVVVWSATPTTWGDAELVEARTRCPIRFQGQWFDEESSLHYNFHRYYEAQIGQYISPDPIGLDGGMQTYGYVHNPLVWVDPLGLAACGATPEPAPRPLGRGSTADPAKGTTLPRDLREQLAIEEAISRPNAGRPLPLKMNDPRWPASDGWGKMQQVIEPGGEPINVHYVRNTITGQVDDFKIVLPGPRPGG
jgi:RHS repeat-associated protein